MEQDSTPQWHVNKEISLGDVLAIIIAVVSVIMAYTSLDGRVKLVETLTNQNTVQISNTISEIKTELRRLADRMERLTEQHIITPGNGR